jgi:hypothetical protein
VLGDVLGDFFTNSSGHPGCRFIGVVNRLGEISPLVKDIPPTSTKVLNFDTVFSHFGNKSVQGTLLGVCMEHFVRTVDDARHTVDDRYTSHC